MQKFDCFDILRYCKGMMITDTYASTEKDGFYSSDINACIVSGTIATEPDFCVTNNGVKFVKFGIETRYVSNSGKFHKNVILLYGYGSIYRILYSMFKSGEWEVGRKALAYYRVQSWGHDDRIDMERLPSTHICTQIMFGYNGPDETE